MFFAAFEDIKALGLTKSILLAFFLSFDVKNFLQLAYYQGIFVQPFKDSPYGRRGFYKGGYTRYMVANENYFKQVQGSIPHCFSPVHCPS
ncbi:hypothetical protein LENED_010760 [Lentinula edodes]|uniref:Uncharacterized protein n=1 Tax=Lentinula edodes TaxID=5353 RepID=A0A1Q3EN98_LENED|nr:hypothetical protein LENED_010760 [Lentinula edodes]